MVWNKEETSEFEKECWPASASGFPNPFSLGSEIRRRTRGGSQSQKRSVRERERDRGSYVTLKKLFEVNTPRAIATRGLCASLSLSLSLSILSRPSPRRPRALTLALSILSPPPFLSFRISISIWEYPRCASVSLALARYPACREKPSSATPLPFLQHYYASLWLSLAFPYRTTPPPPSHVNIVSREEFNFFPIL